jgi:hypothetical protein
VAHELEHRAPEPARSRTRLGEHVRFYWNANNSFGFDRVPWRELNEAVTITTVSRFMKHQMWDFHRDNGYPAPR